MNEWVKKSFELANSKGYLDRLQQVYPVKLDAERPLSPKIRKQIKELFEEKNGTSLLKVLIKLDKFPIKDPYVAFLKKCKEALDYNPKTVKRITNTLYSLGLEKVIKGIEEPKEFNRKIGTLFAKFLPKVGYPLLPEDKFDNYKGIAILAGSDYSLQDYANRKLSYNLEKGLDIVAKSRKQFVIGEAKFLTDFGGHQTAQFEDAMRLIKRGQGKAVRIAILDGVVWLRKKTKMQRIIKNLEDDKIVLSALLLKDFLNALR